MSERLVLDSYAVLCYLGDEKGAEAVQRLLRKGTKGQCELFLNVVNLAEIHYNDSRRNGPERAWEVQSRTFHKLKVG